ncbi:MAG: hypothetical protein Ta2B_04180 [Termitinemataceae bacterium]|nr:MAG: hypothetical protein Ta2B_04180 [Termitinemataceae bacterium]
MNYYEILGISKDATNEEIVKAFRLLAKKYHLDLNDSIYAKSKFILIFEAYSILRDPKNVLFTTILRLIKNQNKTNKKLHTQIGKKQHKMKQNNIQKKHIWNLKNIFIAKTWRK